MLGLGLGKHRKHSCVHGRGEVKYLIRHNCPLLVLTLQPVAIAAIYDT